MDSSTVQVFPLKVKGLECNSFKKSGLVMSTYNPSIVEAETGGSLGLTDRLI